VQGFATQWPVGAQASSAPQSAAEWQAGMQVPVFPPIGQTQGPAGPHTIACGGAASSIVWQSESVLQALGGAAQMPQPKGCPPGLHESVDGQSPFEWHVVAPSPPGPASGGHAIPSSETDHC
jgi:hypothetical protein